MSDEIPSEGERMTMPIPPQMDTQAAFDRIVPELVKVARGWRQRVMLVQSIVGPAESIGLDTSIIDKTLKEIADG